MTLKLGDYLRDLRAAKGYSTWQLAARAGCSQTFISALENGQRSPSLLRLWEIIQVLDGDFRLALFYLCVDMGIPEKEVSGIYQDHKK